MDSGDEDGMLEQSEDEVQTWRIGLHEEGFASDKELNVQDTEHAEEISGGNTNTRHAEEAVDLVASSSSQRAEGSKERVAGRYLLLKSLCGSGESCVFRESWEFKVCRAGWKFTRSCQGQKSADLHGQLSPSELRAHQMPPPS